MSRFIDTQRILNTSQSNTSIVKYSRSEKRYIRRYDEFHKAKRIEAKKRRKRNRKFRKTFTLPTELWQIILEYALCFTDRFPIFRAISKCSQAIINSYLLRFNISDKELMKSLIPCIRCQSYSLFDVYKECVDGCLCFCQNKSCPRYFKDIRILRPQGNCGKCREYTLKGSYYHKNNYLKTIKKIEMRKKLYYDDSSDDWYY